MHNIFKHTPFGLDLQIFKNISKRSIYFMIVNITRREYKNNALNKRLLQF